MKALIFGTTGQDGSYLSELLLEEEYEVYGIVRRCSHSSYERIKHLEGCRNFHIIEGDITDFSSVVNIIQEVRPDEIYNLAAQSHVGTSFKQPLYTWDVTAKGCLNILEAIRIVNSSIKFYQASTSEMFGDNFTLDTDGKMYQDENTSMTPQSPYAIAKLAAHNATKLYRHAYGIFTCSGILFNHESSRRGENFVTRKITKWIGEFVNWANTYNAWDNLVTIDEKEIYIAGRTHRDQGFQFPKLALGNLSASRDWGHARDYVRAMWLMMSNQKPDDFVIATGETHSIREFLEAAFSIINLNYKDFIYIDPAFLRPGEVPYLCGRSEKARKELGWIPIYTFKDLVTEMVQEDIHVCQEQILDTKIFEKKF